MANATFAELADQAGTYVPPSLPDRPVIQKPDLIGVPFIITGFRTYQATDHEYVVVDILREGDEDGVVFMDSGAAIAPALHEMTFPTLIPYGLQLSANGRTWRFSYPPKQD